MLRITVATSGSKATAYFFPESERGEYYEKDAGDRGGRWGGCGAERLGLAGAVERDTFAALADNRRPDGTGRLTARSKSPRRVGYDINFHAPKGVSLLYRVGGDGRILEAFTAAVDRAMRELEKEAGTRVRQGGKDEDRVTGNLIWATFVHETARPVDGVPDPHLHAHCFTFNATWDEVEGRWKALQLGAVKGDASYYEAVFHAELASRMRELGYELEQRGRHWDVAAVPRDVARSFSRRTAEVEAAAERRGITDPERKSELGARTRKRKGAAKSAREVEAAWRDRLGATDLVAAVADARERASAARSAPPPTKEVKAKVDRAVTDEAVRRALDSLLERASVVPERRVVAEALRFGLGRVDVDAVLPVTKRDPPSGQET